MNPDDYIEGTFRNDNPINQKDMDLEDFESDNIAECMEYYKRTGDIEPLENAIVTFEANKVNMLEEIAFCVDVLRVVHNDGVANRLQRIKNNLKNS